MRPNVPSGSKAIWDTSRCGRGTKTERSVSQDPCAPRPSSFQGQLALPTQGPRRATLKGQPGVQAATENNGTGTQRCENLHTSDPEGAGDEQAPLVSQTGD